MPKIKIILPALCLLIPLAMLLFAPIYNDSVAQKIADDLAALPLPSDTILLEQTSLAGKLVGEGNGMQYFGAILIQSGLPQDALQAHYAPFAPNSWSCQVAPQTSSSLSLLEHARLSFKTPIATKNAAENAADGGYYIVYTWGDNTTIFHELDLRGH